MAREVRVGDSVNLQLANGEVTTAEVTAVTNQNTIDVEYFHHDEAALKTAVAGATRATTFPAAANEFWKQA